MFTRRVMVAFLISLLLLAALLLLPTHLRATQENELPPPEHSLWMNWHADQFALTDDGESIWIGASGSVLQWNKATGATRRYGPIDGLFHRQVLAAAVDGAGNRWFGGDAGLSRLGADGKWTHYTAENGDLPVNLVDAIAVGADDTLWLSHGLPDGRVSQWDPDGTRHEYPHRSSAVTAAYAQVKQTVNANDLWAVAGDDVWTGYDVYDGADWERRPPPNDLASPRAVRADSQGGIWVLADDVYSWDGSGWSTYEVDIQHPGYGSSTALAVGPDDSVWVGWQDGVSATPSAIYAAVTRLPDEPGTVPREGFLNVRGPVAALLPTAGATWAIGPAWLLQPDGIVAHVEDVPTYEEVTTIAKVGEKSLFVDSQYGEYGGRVTLGTTQTVDDQGTIGLLDDQWQIALDLAIVNAAEPAPDGGLWVAGDYSSWRFGSPAGPLRYEKEYGWIDYGEAVGSTLWVSDIFAASDRNTWFAYERRSVDWEWETGVLALDDGGTPADLADDIWTDYPSASDGNELGQLMFGEGKPAAVAVDGLGRLWYGDSTGLYRHSGAAWEAIDAEHAVCDMVPAADGTLFVRAVEDCDDFSDSSLNIILVIRPDGRREWKHIASIVEEEFGRVATASHRNQLWTVAPDGGVWYLRIFHDLRIERYDGAELVVYDLPPEQTLEAGVTLEVDKDNHLWLVAGEQLWRLGRRPEPDFGLGEQFWLLEPDSSGQKRMAVHSIDGYDGSVALELSGLPAGVTAAFAPNPVPAGEATLLTLTVDESAALGAYNATLRGTDGTITHTVPFNLRIVPTVYGLYTPVVAANH